MKDRAKRHGRVVLSMAKRRLLSIWDNPPAMLLWLLLTGATVGALKAMGL